EDWQWSNFRHYAAGFEGRVSIESERTAQEQWVIRRQRDIHQSSGNKCDPRARGPRFQLFAPSRTRVPHPCVLCKGGYPGTHELEVCGSHPFAPRKDGAPGSLIERHPHYYSLSERNIHTTFPSWMPNS